ncbi:MAG TPA: monovalent cation/H(+) antiporter subunit G [Noviherbaspirillum sp.]|jgi:multicomponent Na+:H+ antiporter subunit G|uniref:cation:proton antiporter n=1 Tax=Noviherbaspirillum sp. TaxID=1926288 RepID=UPI002DDD458C|nr:monovalent cation/H(+) antiporter subunit G [Noviherbaspirillum sp.]HEV2609476.1 monovalent cation/H(+) antiporter subunit G [Noviherbaspirillum sp.]
MSAIEIIGNACLLIGAAFFLAGTIALLRFPDVYTRLHALAKVDNIGLGFTTLGLLPRVDDPASGLKLILVWMLVLAASAATSFLVARRIRRRGIAHWERPQQ